MLQKYTYFLIGRSHIANKTLCQDRATVGTIDGVTFAVVADGVGSHPYSGHGADLAMLIVERIAIGLFEDIFNNPQTESKNLIQIAQRYARDWAERLGLTDHHDISCTMSMVLVKDNRYIALNIGDSPIFIIHKDKAPELLTMENKDFINSTISFFSSSALDDFVVRVGIVDNIQRFVLATDGAADGLHNSSTNEFAGALLKPFTRNRVREVVKDIRDNLTHDDCALSVIEI